MCNDNQSINYEFNIIQTIRVPFEFYLFIGNLTDKKRLNGDKNRFLVNKNRFLRGKKRKLSPKWTIFEKLGTIFTKLKTEIKT
jgi:hypothetical protein